MSNTHLDKMTRGELITLEVDIRARIKKFRPYRIRERCVTCGVKDCWCQSGSDRHGPYLYVSWRNGGKSQTRSLGLKIEQWEFDEWLIEWPELTSYLNIPDYEYWAEADEFRERQAYVKYKLTQGEFFERHGVYMKDDTFSRAKVYYGTAENLALYKADFDLALEMEAIPKNPWASWGVGTLAGIAILGQLEKEGLYHKT